MNPDRPNGYDAYDRFVVLPDDRPGTIVVVADTHSRPDARAEALIQALAPDAILHGGDIGALTVLDRLATLAPVLHAVRGNIDEHAPDVPERLAISVRRGGGEVLRVFLTHIAVTGPRLLKAARVAATAARADLVVCGHSHVPLIARDGALAVFNPGSIGPRRFGLPIAFGVMTFGERLSFRHVDCDTGDTWDPKKAAAASRG
ncbi:MAG: metallophosphoesterase family protein [Myxococcota bacterium]